MKVTEIEFIPVNPNKGLVGFCSFVLNNSVKFNHVGIHTLIDGSRYRLVYPALRGLQCCYPINKEVGDFITSEITERWNKFQS